MSLEYNKNLIPRAKKLRKNATPQENELWYKFLRTYPIRFKRQKTIGQFIVDFYCHQAKLAIELDGSQHFTPEGITHDEARTADIETVGVTVLRFTNREIDSEFRAVCTQIDTAVHERLNQEKEE
jgi:very-short-patch-repair endonuclease